ncbi:MAG: DNA-binding protein [Chloroflexi bacterium]|nr:MAG: DNA-binding protein [Chloroflexota bacterium]
MGQEQPEREVAARMLTTTQVAELLGVHPNTVRKWANQGFLQVVRLGPRGDRRFPEEEIARLLRKNQNET